MELVQEVIMDFKIMIQMEIAFQKGEGYTNCSLKWTDIEFLQTDGNLYMMKNLYIIEINYNGLW
jgi:hypothetical protein